jgi:hypothetical protein
MELDPRVLAARLGAVSDQGSDLPLKVVPSDPSFSLAEVFVDDGSGQTSMVNLVPATQLTLAALRDSLGPYRESPRLHPHDPRKFLFSPSAATPRPYVIHVVAYVSDGPVESAAVLRVVIMCSPATAAMNTISAEAASKLTTTTVWPRLLGERAGFGVRSWRDSNLDAVREELERALGVWFVASHDKVYDGAPAFECVTPACTLRLNSWPTDTPALQLFNFIGEPSEDLDMVLPKPENISEAVASHLRAAGRDWYVPDPLEKQISILGERQLEPDVLVAILAPRWLAWFTGEEREVGGQLLRSIAEMWVSAARRTSDPIADLKRRRADFEIPNRYIPPRSRLTVLVSYAVQEQLSIIEEELFQLKEMPAAERAALPGTSARLAEWRDVLVALEEPVRQTHIDSIRRQRDELLASIDDLFEKLPDTKS